MLKTKIKAGQITNLTDARYFAAWDVEWLGFCLTPHTENFVPFIEVAAIKEWVEGPKIVGEFSLQAPDEILTTIQNLELDAIQLDMFVGEDVLEKLDNTSIIKEIVVENQDALIDDLKFHIDKFERYTDTFLIDLDKNNIAYAELNPSNLEYLQLLCQQKKIILSIPIQASQLDDLIEKINPSGLQVKGGEEEKVGFKSFDELDDIFEALETFE